MGEGVTIDLGQEEEGKGEGEAYREGDACGGGRDSRGLGGGGMGDVRQQRSWQGWRHRIPIPIDRQSSSSLTTSPFGDVY